MSGIRKGIKGAFKAALLLAAGAFAAACGKGAGGSGDAAVPPAGPPAPAESSGWFPGPGPESLGRFLDLRPGTGFSDVLLLGRDLIALGSGGSVHRLSEGSREFLPAVLPHPVRAAVAAAADADSLYLADEAGEVRSFSPARDPAAPVGWEERWSSSQGFVPDWLIAAEGLVLCASGDGKTAVLSASDGSRVSFLDSGVDLIARPVAAGAVLVLPRSEGLSALKLPSLEFLWKGDRPPAVSGVFRSARGGIAYQDAEGAVRMADAAEGTELFALPAAERADVASDGERWYIAGADGSLGAFNFSDGVPVWTAGSSRLSAGPGAAPARFRPRLAVGEGRLYLAGPEGLEIWDSRTGELLERASAPAWADGLYLIRDRLFVRGRGGMLRVYGEGPEAPAGLDLEARVRPPEAAAERIAARIGAYAEPGAALRIAWRPYVPGASPSPDARFTVFRFEAKEAGNRVLSVSSRNPGSTLLSLFDATGEERHTNVGELGVDASFTQWMEPGVWYAASGRLRGAEEGDPGFLDIRSNK